MGRYTRCKWETWQLATPPISPYRSVGRPRRPTAAASLGEEKRRWRKTDLLFLRVRFLCRSLTSSFSPVAARGGKRGRGKKRRFLFLTWITRRGGGGQKSTKPEDRQQKKDKRKKKCCCFLSVLQFVCSESERAECT